MSKRNLVVILLVVIISLVCMFNTSLHDRVFRYVAHKIADESLDDVSQQALYEGGLSGMTGIISDHPYTSYLPPEELGEYEHELQGEIVGIGIFHVQKDVKTGEFSFIPVFGTPAARAGLKLGDRIVMIDQKPVKDIPVWDAFDLLRGKEGSKVVLKIRPAGVASDAPESKLKDVQITRGLFRQDIVCGDRREKDGSWNFCLKDHPETGYIAVTQFTDATVPEFAYAVDQLEKQNVKKVILDFRGNPGGFLPGAVQICDMFVPAGKDIVTTRRRGGAIKDRFIATDCKKYAFQLIVLVDEESASASEIVSACLQDHKCATIAGNRSYGKGTVQELFALPCQMGELRLTNASFWRPSNVPLHRFPTSKPTDSWGVTPNDGFLVALKGYPKMFSIVARDLRRSLPFDQVDQAVADTLKNYETLIDEMKQAKSVRVRRQYEALLGLDSKSGDDEKNQEHHSVIPRGKPAPSNADSTDLDNFKPAGKAPYFDPQLEKAIAFFSDRQK
ncbi:MAG: S41 family peptidase [Thermoguttaceae bacterium]|nr:S41 family peptidase [Thermoguttaceae bacterium]